MKLKPLLFSLAGLVLSLDAAAQNAVPALNTNDWNFILVPSFDAATEEGANTLSVQGLNHSLSFGQVLDTLTAGKESSIRQVYALNTKADPDDLAPLQSVEPFAVLNNLSVLTSPLDMKNQGAWDGPAGFIGQVMGNEPKGIYVMSGSPAVIGALAKAMGASTDTVPDGDDFMVAAGPALPLAVTGYADGVNAEAAFPSVTLPPKSSTCTDQPSVTFTIDPPEGLKPYTGQTVYMVRHVEAHPTPAFENGNYVCQGQWRALGSPDILLDAMGGTAPDYVYAPDPADIINCNGAVCSYIRATLTVAPFAVKNGLPLTLAEFGWNNGTDLAEALFNTASPYFPRADSGEKILVGWEHAHIVVAVEYLVNTLYANPAAAAKLPDWPYYDYDSIWKLETDATGRLTFSNSCEHIPSASLPSTCPAFMPPLAATSSGQ